MIVRIRDVVNRVNNNIDRFNTDIKYYLGKGHGECGELAITEHGDLKKDVGLLGFKFHFAFKPGDSLFFSRSFALRKAGMATYEGLCSDSTYILRSKDNNVLLPEYLPIVIQSESFWDYCNTHHTGGVNFLINWNTLADYEFDLPPIEEQRMLADKLWSAYRLKESYKKLLTATQEMVKSQFIEMFKNDKMVPLGKFCSIEKGSTITRNEVSPGDIPVVAGGQEPSCYHNVSNREAGMITVSASGAYAGFVNYWTCPIFASDCNTISPKEKNATDTTFLFYGMKALQKHIYGLQKGGAQPHVYGKDLQNLLFPLPTIDKQSSFSRIAQQADKSEFELRKSIEAIDQVIKSLINDIK